MRGSFFSILIFIGFLCLVTQPDGRLFPLWPPIISDGVASLGVVNDGVSFPVLQHARTGAPVMDLQALADPSPSLRFSAVLAAFDKVHAAAGSVIYMRSALKTALQLADAAGQGKNETTLSDAAPLLLNLQWAWKRVHVTDSNVIDVSSVTVSNGTAALVDRHRGRLQPVQAFFLKPSQPMVVGLLLLLLVWLVFRPFPVWAVAMGPGPVAAAPDSVRCGLCGERFVVAAPAGSRYACFHVYDCAPPQAPSAAAATRSTTTSFKRPPVDLGLRAQHTRAAQRTFVGRAGFLCLVAALFLALVRLVRFGFVGAGGSPPPAPSASASAPSATAAAWMLPVEWMLPVGLPAALALVVVSVLFARFRGWAPALLAVAVVHTAYVAATDHLTVLGPDWPTADSTAVPPVALALLGYGFARLLASVADYFMKAPTGNDDDDDAGDAADDERNAFSTWKREPLWSVSAEMFAWNGALGALALAHVLASWRLFQGSRLCFAQSAAAHRLVALASAHLSVGHPLATLRLAWAHAMAGWALQCCGFLCLFGPVALAPCWLTATGSLRALLLELFVAGNVVAGCVYGGGSASLEMALTLAAVGCALHVFETPRERALVALETSHSYLTGPSSSSTSSSSKSSSSSSSQSLLGSIDSDGGDSEKGHGRPTAYVEFGKQDLDTASLVNWLQSEGGGDGGGGGISDTVARNLMQSQLSAYELLVLGPDTAADLGLDPSLLQRLSAAVEFKPPMHGRRRPTASSAAAAAASAQAQAPAQAAGWCNVQVNGVRAVCLAWFLGCMLAGAYTTTVSPNAHCVGQHHQPGAHHQTSRSLLQRNDNEPTGLGLQRNDDEPTGLGLQRNDDEPTGLGLHVTATNGGGARDVAYPDFLFTLARVVGDGSSGLGQPVGRRRTDRGEHRVCVMLEPVDAFQSVCMQPGSQWQTSPQGPVHQASAGRLWTAAMRVPFPFPHLGPVGNVRSAVAKTNFWDLQPGRPRMDWRSLDKPLREPCRLAVLALSCALEFPVCTSSNDRQDGRGGDQQQQTQQMPLDPVMVDRVRTACGPAHAKLFLGDRIQSLVASSSSVPQFRLTFHANTTDLFWNGELGIPEHKSVWK